MSLYAAARDGDLARVNELLDDPKTSIHQRGTFGNTPLMIACENNHVDVVRAILTHKKGLHMNINAKSYEHYSSLDVACIVGNLMIIGLLIQRRSIDFTPEFVKYLTRMICNQFNRYQRPIKSYPPHYALKFLFSLRHDIDIIYDGAKSIFDTGVFRTACGFNEHECVRVLLRYSDFKFGRRDEEESRHHHRHRDHRGLTKGWRILCQPTTARGFASLQSLMAFLRQTKQRRVARWGGGHRGRKGVWVKKIRLWRG